MEKEKFDLIDFENCGYEFIDKGNLPFGLKGVGKNLILFKEKGTCDYFAIERAQLEKPMPDFLRFCMLSVYPFFNNLKYGDKFLSQAKAYHEEMRVARYKKNMSPKSFPEDLEEFSSNLEKDFIGSLGINKFYPASIIRKGSLQWEQYNEFLKNKQSKRESIFIENELKKNNIAVFCLNDDKTLTLLKHYTGDLSYNILRGKGTIGNLIEVNYGTINLLLDCGKELDTELAKLSKQERDVLAKCYDGVLISHYHIDHAGLIPHLKSPIYMGKSCLDVLNSQIKYMHCQPLENISTFTSGQQFLIKKGNFQIEITPILVDHSAYDSYMFLLRGGDKTLLYTGDFRSNGRKSFDLTLAALPQQVDYLICEATNMFSQVQNISEAELENQAAAIMEEYKHVFVFQAGTNIDRLVSFYKASRKNHKAFLIDTYVAGITENLPNIPNVKTFQDVYCFWDFPSKFTDDVKKYHSDWRLMRKSHRGVGSYNIGNPKDARYGNLSNFTMLVRPSMLNYLKRIDEDKKKRFHSSIFENSVLIYSLWQGYKENDDVKNFLQEMEKFGVKIIDLHTSGHADKQTIDMLKQKVNPGIIEYVHYIK